MTVCFTLQKTPCQYPALTTTVTLHDILSSLLHRNHCNPRRPLNSLESSRETMISCPKKVLAVLFVGVLTSVTLGQVPHVGKCPVVETQATLNVTQYLGKWYEIQRFPAIFEKGSCVRAEYSLKANGRVKVDNRYIESGYETHALGEAWVPDPKYPAVLNVQFNQAIPPAQYKVIETDYESYSLVFSCEDVAGIIDFQFAWILSRKLTLPDDLVTRLKQKLQSYQVDVTAFIVSDQTNCPM